MLSAWQTRGPQIDHQKLRPFSQARPPMPTRPGARDLCSIIALRTCGGQKVFRLGSDHAVRRPVRSARRPRAQILPRRIPRVSRRQSTAGDFPCRNAGRDFAGAESEAPHNHAARPPRRQKDAAGRQNAKELFQSLAVIDMFQHRRTDDEVPACVGLVYAFDTINCRCFG